jgi:hypothetical protein
MKPASDSEMTAEQLVEAYAKGRAEAIAEIEARIGEAYDGFPGDWATDYERGVKNGIAICARFCRSLILKEQEGRNG